MKLRFPVLVVALAACGGGSASTTTATTEVPIPKPEPAKTFAVHLHSPSKVGSKTHVVVDANEDRTTNAIKGTEVIEKKREKKLIHFDAVATTVAVDGKQESSKTHYDVTELTVDGKPALKGTVDLTRAAKGDDAVVMVNGALATKEQRETLKSVLTYRIGGPTDDEIFGTAQPQAIGGRWAINSKLAQEDLEGDEGMQTSAITGDAHLEGVAKVGDLDCLDIRSEMKLEGLSLPNKPAGSTVERGEATAKFSGMFPVDPSHGRVQDHLALEVRMKLRVPTKVGDVMVEVIFADQKDGRFTQL